MTNIILNKLDKKKEMKKDRQLWISRSKASSRFQGGVLNLSKNFMKNTNKGSNSGQRKPRPNNSQNQNNNFKRKNL